MKNKKYIVYLIVSILVLTIGVSYAYFKARVNCEGKSISLRSKGIYVLYSGDATLASVSISPGWSVTKEFTVENQGSNNEVYNIYIEGLVNTFVTSVYLQYKITSSNGLFEVTQAVADKFSASTTGGVNEMFFSSPYAWYYTNSQGESITDNPWWSLSSSDGGTSRAYVWYVIGSDDPGRLDFNNVQYDFDVCPAISLSSCATIKSGNGTPESPYEIDESSCS